jgi:hypothetical protein
MENQMKIYLFALMLLIIVFVSSSFTQPSSPPYGSIQDGPAFLSLYHNNNPSIYADQTDTARTDIQADTIKRMNISSRRNFFGLLNIGLLEVYALGFGYQLSDEWSCTIKYSGIVISGKWAYIGPDGATGWGLQVKRYFSQIRGILPINNISLQPSILWRTSNTGETNIAIRGYAVEVNAGYENIEASKLRIFWSVGAILSRGNSGSPLPFPSLKFGVNYNL